VTGQRVRVGVPLTPLAAARVVRLGLGKTPGVEKSDGPPEVALGLIRQAPNPRSATGWRGKPVSGASGRERRERNATEHESRRNPDCWLTGRHSLQDHFVTPAKAGLFVRL